MHIDNPSIISHLSVATHCYHRAVRFYDQVLACIGAVRVMERGGAAAYGKFFPEFWIQQLTVPLEHTPKGDTHIAFAANSREEVDLFYRKAISLGAACQEVPGPQPRHGEPFYGCVLTDLDGNLIAASYWDAELAAKLC